MKTSIRTDTKLWVFEQESGDRIYVFGYTWFEARGGALAALQQPSAMVTGHEIGNIKDHLVEAGSTIVCVDRGSTWFEIVETLRRMSGEEARKLLAFPSPFEDPKPAICKNQFTDHLDGGRFYVCELLAGHDGEQHVCGDVGWPVEPASEAMLEALPLSSPAHPTSAELRDRLIADAEHNADWPEMARIASQAIDALEAKELQSSVSFEDAWKVKVADGYQYGRDALEQVRFGWDLRKEMTGGRRENEGDGGGGVHSVHGQDGLHHLRGPADPAFGGTGSEAQHDDVGAVGAGHSESAGLLAGSGESDAKDGRGVTGVSMVEVRGYGDTLRKRVYVGGTCVREEGPDDAEQLGVNLRNALALWSRPSTGGWKEAAKWCEEQAEAAWDVIEAGENDANGKHFLEGKVNAFRAVAVHLVAKQPAQDDEFEQGKPEAAELHVEMLATRDAEIGRLKTEKDAAYDERNRLVALFASMALALGWKAGVGQHEDEPGKEWDADWRTLVMVETPEGQASWHFHDSQNHLVKHLPSYVVKWDGHDTPTKYARLEKISHARLAASPWETAARECDIWAARSAKKAEESRGHDVWAGFRAEADGFIQLGIHFRGLARRLTRDPNLGQDMTRNPTTEEELARVRSELNHYREKYLNDDRIPLANTEIIRLGREIIQRDVEIERLRTISKADAAGTVKAVDYAEDAREEIAQLQSEVTAMRTSIQFCSGSCRLPEDTAPMVDGVRLPAPDPLGYAEDVRECIETAVAVARDEAEEIANEAMRAGWAECNRLRVRIAALNTGDIVHQDEKMCLTKKISVLEGKLAEVTEFEKRTRHHLSEFTAACNRADAAEFALADVQTEVEKRQLVTRADYKRVYARYMGRRSDPHAHHDSGDLEHGRFLEAEHMCDFIRARISGDEKKLETAHITMEEFKSDPVLSLATAFTQGRVMITNSVGARCLLRVEMFEWWPDDQDSKLPTPERRAQEIAHLEEKYAINAAVASRLQPKERNPWTLQYAEDHAEVEAEKVRYETEAIREIGGCGTIAGTKPYERACILPMGHPGPHGWQESAESSVVVRLEAAQGGFRAVVGSPHDAGFVMMAAIDIEDDARFYVDSANKALGPFLQAAYRRGLLKGAEECRVVAAEMDRRTSGSRNAANKEADVRYRAKRDAASECQMLIEALAKVAT